MREKDRERESGRGRARERDDRQHERERQHSQRQRSRENIHRERGRDSRGGERERVLEPEGVLEGATKRVSDDTVQGAVLPTTSTGVMLIKETMATTWMATWTTGPLTMMGNGSK